VSATNQVLAATVNGAHLLESAERRARSELEAHAARLVVLDDFLVPAVAASLARFLATDAIFEHEHGLYSVEGAVPRERWEAVDDADRFFRYGRLVGVPDERRLSEDVLTYLQFRQAFQQPGWRGYFERVSGLALAGSDDVGAHRMADGDYLRPHSDDNRDRALALVLYLSPGWEPSWGGQLLVCDAHGVTSAVDPIFNRLVAFDVAVGSSHAVAPVAAPDGAARYTIGGWYHRPAGGGA
jgi:hypothetical protein